LFAPRREEKRDQYRDIAGHQTQVETRQQQHKAIMSAENYLMQEELGSMFEQRPQPARIHPNISQAARSASYTALSTSDQANPWR
jgi:hypothetical protein